MDSRHSTEWPPGDGAMAARVRTHAWASTPVGPPEAWPACLRTALALMLGSGHPMFLAWGPELRMFFNDAYAPVLGAKLDGALGRPLAEVWPDAWEQVSPMVRDALAGRGTWAEDLPVRLNRNGYDETAYFTFSYGPLYDEVGAVRGLFCALTETTGKVLAERGNARLAAEQRAAAERLQRMFDHAPAFVAELRGPDHRFASFNEAYRALTGYRELSGLRLRDALPEADAQGYVARLDGAYASGEPFVLHGAPFDVERPRGGPLERVYVDFVCQPLRDADGAVDGLLVLGHEVTEQHRAMESLRESERRFRLIAENTPVGYYRWDLRSGMVTLPRRIRELFGIEDESVHADRLWERIHPDDAPALRAGVESALDPAGRGEMRASYRVLHADGSLRWADSVAQAYFTARPDGGRCAVEVFGVVWDVTEHQRMVQSLRDADERKNEFLAMLAHELRNPLAPLVNAHRLLERSASLSEADRRVLALAARQTRQLTRLVDDLLEVSRISRGMIDLKPEPMLVGGAVHHAVESVAHLCEQRGHALSVELPSRPVRIVADPVRVAQILENLLTNACKYTPDGGTIRVSAVEREDAIELSVSDSGIGIEPAKLAGLFELFHQIDAPIDRAAGGLGIGLALVRRLAEMHGGTVAAASEGPGRGACFTVRLPRRPASHGDAATG